MVSSNDGFWTQTSGICTIVGLGIGSILAIVTLWLMVLSYRQMKHMNVRSHPVLPSFGEPPPPYILTPNPLPFHEAEKKSEKKGKKTDSTDKLFARSSTSDSSDELAVGTGSGSAFDSNDESVDRAGMGTTMQRRKCRLGRKRWLILLLVVLILLVGGLIAVAANISNIQKMSAHGSPLRAAVLPDPATVSVSVTPVTSTITSAPGTSVLSTTTLVTSPTSMSTILLSSSMTRASPTSTATSTPPPKGPYTYQGCISDNVNRTLTGGYATTDVMTTEACATQCVGFAYFGTEYGSQCYCGNTIWQFAGMSEAADDHCATPCDGDQNEICGGTWWMSLYKVNQND